MKYQIIFVLILTLHSSIICAQRKNNTIPIYKYLKANADSTIIMRYESNWEIDPEYFMLSKKGDTINAYTYKIVSNLDKRIVIPHHLRYRLYQNTQVPADINSYFNAQYLSADSLRKFWEELMLLKPWNINDDQIEGAGCSIDQDSLQRQIRDASSIKLALITKKNTKELSFYAPQYYETEICPGRKGRQTVIMIEKLFKTYCKDE